MARYDRAERPLTDKQRVVLEATTAEPSTVHEIAERAGVTHRGAYSMLMALKAKLRVERVGREWRTS